MFLCVKCFDSTVSAAFDAFIKVLESFLTVDPSAGYYIKKTQNPQNIQKDKHGTIVIGGTWITANEPYGPH